MRLLILLMHTKTIKPITNKEMKYAKRPSRVSVANVFTLDGPFYEFIKLVRLVVWFRFFLVSFDFKKEILKRFCLF